MVCILAKGSGDCASRAYHDHPHQRLLQNFPDTTSERLVRRRRAKAAQASELNNRPRARPGCSIGNKNCSKLQPAARRRHQKGYKLRSGTTPTASPVPTSGPPRRSGPKARKWVAIIPEIDREHPRGLGRAYSKREPPTERRRVPRSVHRSRKALRQYASYPDRRATALDLSR